MILNDGDGLTGLVSSKLVTLSLVLFDIMQLVE